MTTAKEIGRRAGRAQKRALRNTEPWALLGKARSNGDLTLRGDSANNDLLDDNQVYIRLFGLDTELHVAWCTTVGYKVGNSVVVKQNIDGDFEVLRLYSKGATRFLGKAARDFATPERLGVAPNLTQGRDFMPGRLRLAEADSLLVTVEEGFWFFDTLNVLRYWDPEVEDPLDLSSNVPTASGGVNRAGYVVVTFDTDAAGPGLVATTTAEQVTTLPPLQRTALVGFSVPDDHLLVGAVQLETGDTTVTDEAQFVDMRPHMVGRSSGGTGGGSIAVTDSVTTVDPATLLNVDPTFFNVTGGGGDALLTFVGTAAEISYTPVDTTDYGGSDPGDTDAALDYLAAHLKDAEDTIAGLSAGGVSASGWVALGQTLTYGSADDPTYTAVCAGVDLTSILSLGMRIRVSQSTGGTKYFILTGIAFSTDTTLTLYGGTDYDLNNEAISNPYFSIVKAPHGFPLDPTKWRVLVADTSARGQASPTLGVWYNLGTLLISVPIGVWQLGYRVNGHTARATAGNTGVYITLSTANNSESDVAMTCFLSGNNVLNLFAPVARQKAIALTSKTTHYLIAKADVSGQSAINVRGELGTTLLFAECAYL